MSSMKHIMTTEDIADTKWLNAIFDHTDKLKTKLDPLLLKGKLVATLFYEPSTRTRLSFESAVQRLGGEVISVENAAISSSATKGETLADTARVMSAYADAIVMRHPEPGSVAELAYYATVPVINAGDGAHEHPTQALLDMYTIKNEMGSYDNLTFAFVGDLKHSRTIHSLLDLISRHPQKKVYLVSPEELQLPEATKTLLKKRGLALEETSDVAAVAPLVDVIYSNRVQKERLNNDAVYEKVKSSFILTLEIVKTMPEHGIVMNPLPRVNEIPPEVDDDPRACYFRQAKNGVYVRMALLADLLK